MTKTTPKPPATPIAPNFEFFQGNLSESSSVPQITVRRGGLMVLTAAAADLLGQGVERVQLAYDRASRTVGIRTAIDEAPGAYRLRQQGKSLNRLVGGKRFFNYNEIPTEKAATFEVIDYGKGLIGFKMTSAATEEKAA